MSFLATPIGQRVGLALAGAGSLAAFGAVWLPQMVFIEDLKSIVHHYERGFPLQLTEDLRERANRVLREFTPLTDEQKATVQFFHVGRFEPFSAGNPRSGYGAIIGLPKYFAFTSVNKANLDGCKIFGDKPVDWTTPAGLVLKRTFILSDEAQRFAIARQIYLSNTSHVAVNSLTAGGAAFNVYFLSKLVNRRIPKSTPFGARCIVYGIASLFSVIVYFAVTDMVRYRYEYDSIIEVAKLGVDYRRGAIEYFEKCLLRNKALRVLLGSKGASRFTLLGDYNTWIRTPHMKLTSCLGLANRLQKNMDEPCDVCEEISGKKAKSTK